MDGESTDNIDEIERFLYGSAYRRYVALMTGPLLRKHDLQEIDLFTLSALWKLKGKNTAKDLAELNVRTKGHISQSLHRLKSKGFINMNRDRSDRRVVHNILTEKAEMVIKEAQAVHEDMNRKLLQGISRSDMDRMAGCIGQIMENLQACIDAAEEDHRAEK